MQRPKGSLSGYSGKAQKSVSSQRMRRKPVKTREEQRLLDQLWQATGYAELGIGFRSAPVSPPTTKVTYQELLVENERLREIVAQVDSVLVTHWVVVKDDNYCKALHDYAGFCIQIENDPAVSETAKARANELDTLRRERDLARGRAIGHAITIGRLKALLSKYGMLNDINHVCAACEQRPHNAGCPIEEALKIEVG